MTWFRVDDGFPEHPKVEALEADPRRYMAAITVWTVMGADCARRLTDGFVSPARLTKVLHHLGKAATDGASALVAVGIWDVVDGGWKFHDWDEYQPTKAYVDASRKAKTERQRRWRGGRVDASTAMSTSSSTSSSVDEPGDAAHARVSRPVPTQPIPTKESARDHEPTTTNRVEHGDVVALFARLRSEAHQTKHGRPGGTYRRSPRDWQPVEDLCAWASDQPEPTAALEDSLRGYLADEWAAGAGWPISAWAKDPGRYSGRFLAQEGAKKATEEEIRLQVALKGLRARYDAARGTDEHPRILQEIIATREMLRVCRQQMEGAA